MKARMPIPDAIAGAPALRGDLRWVWDAFSDLTTERHPGAMGPPGHIPWRAIHAYAAAKGLTEEEEDIFVELVKAMDDAYIEHVAKQLDKGKARRPEATDVDA